MAENETADDFLHNDERELTLAYQIGVKALALAGAFFVA